MTRVPGLTKLGSGKTRYPAKYDPKLLEAFETKEPRMEQWVSLVCAEFTSLCPITGQPDFGRIFVNYVAGERMVESKSLKLYLFGFRNHGAFHEECVRTICSDLAKLLAPRYIEVAGEFTPRGGIAIQPFASADNGEPRWARFRQERLAGYAPGKYTLAFGRPY